MDSVIQLRDVVVDHGRFKLDVPALDIPRGRVVGMVGANGAGKTTLLKLLPALTLPHQGTIEVLGRDPAKETMWVRHRLAWMSDDMPLFDLRVDKLLYHLSAFYPTWDLDLTRELVERLDVDLSWKVGSISKGQGTRLRLVCALAWRPTVVILDEPATGLDLAGRRALLSTVLEVAQDEDRTVVVSSHQLADVERISDHYIIMHEGQVAHDGAAHDLLQEGRGLEEQMVAWGLVQ